MPGIIEPTLLLDEDRCRANIRRMAGKVMDTGARFRPHFKRIWEHARSKTSAFLAHHCCGSIRPFIRDFVDLGVQVLNPVQVSASAMQPAELKREFGRNLAFWGGIDTREVMPRGTVEDVRAEVARRIHELASGGGYILAAVHNLQPEVPPANVVAMFGAGRELGGYDA